VLEEHSDIIALSMKQKVLERWWWW